MHWMVIGYEMGRATASLARAYGCSCCHVAISFVHTLIFFRPFSLCTGLLPRMDSMVIGCGMGRAPASLARASAVIRIAREKGLPVVVDGDALFLIAQNPGVGAFSQSSDDFQNVLSNVLGNWNYRSIGTMRARAQMMC